MDLKQRWDARFPSNPGVGRDLLARYAEPHRRYHDSRHLAEMLGTIDTMTEHSVIAELPDAVELAAWFHDAVYDPRTLDSERRSSELAQDLLVGNFPDATVTEVARLITLTVDHRPEEWDVDGAILCDADLAVLARPSASYDEYARAVREEYAHVDDEHFRTGRTHVLERLLSFDHLFTTGYGADHWEDPARANLRRELAELRG